MVRGRAGVHRNIIPDSYKAKSDVQLQKDATTAADAVISLSPAGRVYTVGKGAYDLVNDSIQGNYTNTQNNLLGAVIPKVLRKVTGANIPTGATPDVADVVGVVVPAVRGSENE